MYAQVLNARLGNNKTLHNPLFSTDFYKLGHKEMMPDNVDFVMGNYTPRFDKYLNVDRDFYKGHYVQFGIQAYLAHLTDRWNEYFFSRPEDEVIGEFERLVSPALFTKYDCEHFRRLHRLGYLPVAVYAIEEGAQVPVGVASMIFHETVIGFGWLVTYLETDMSAGVWQTQTNATVAFNFRKMLEHYHRETGTDGSLIPWQGHDFSARGMVHYLGAGFSGMAHATSFCGSDTVQALPYLDYFYGASFEKNFVLHSVRASEHSVTCMHGEDNEEQTVVGWMKKFPTGIMSNVLDTWDYFKVINEMLPRNKDVIYGREGKYVCRPDSGDPVKIVTGYKDGEYRAQVVEGGVAVKDLESGRLISAPEFEGSTKVLARHFGTTTNAAGFKDLHEKIGQIYGDSINVARGRSILERSKADGFTANIIVFGIGSYTYQYNTRDSLGSAVKVTYCIVDGKGRNVQKNPKTGDGSKKSAKGLFRVEKFYNEELEMDSYRQVEFDATELEVMGGAVSYGELKLVWRDSSFDRATTLSKIRFKLHGWDDRYDTSTPREAEPEDTFSGSVQVIPYAKAMRMIGKYEDGSPITEAA